MIKPEDKITSDVEIKNKKRKIRITVSAVALLIIVVGMLVYYNYNYGVLPTVSFENQVVEKYSELSKFDFEAMFVSENSDEDLIYLKTEDKLELIETVLMDEDITIVIESRYRKQVVQSDYEISVSDTILPIITVMNGDELVSEGETLEFFENDYDRDKISVSASDMRNDIEVSLPTINEVQAIPEESSVGEYDIELSVSDGTHETLFNFIIVIKEIPSVPQNTNVTSGANGSSNANGGSNGSGSVNNSGSTNNGSSSSNTPTTPREPYIDNALTDSLVADINLLRDMNGLPPLSHSSSIHALAVPRAFNRWAAQTILHDGVPEGYAENLLIGNVADRSRLTSSMMVGWWDNSPGHRGNILDPRWTTTGVAVLVIEEWSDEWNKMTYSFMAVQLFQ